MNQEEEEEEKEKRRRDTEAREFKKQVFGEKVEYKRVLERPNAQTARPARPQGPCVDVLSSCVENMRTRFFDPPRVGSSFPSLDYGTSMEWAAASRAHPAMAYLTKFVTSQHNKPTKTPVQCVAWDPLGRRVYTGSFAGELNIWNGTSYRFEKNIENEAPDGSAHVAITRVVCDSVSGNLIVAADKRGVLAYFNYRTKNTRRFRAHAHQEITGLSVLWDGSLVASGATDGLLRLWDVATGECRCDIGLAATAVSTREAITCVAFQQWSSDSGNPIVWASTRHGALLRADTRMSRIVDTRLFHHRSVSEVAVHRHLPLCLTASLDGRIALVDFRRLDTPCEWFQFDSTSAFTHRPAYSSSGYKKKPNNGFTSIAWHPLVDHVFVSGSTDGTLAYFSPRGRPCPPMPTEGKTMRREEKVSSWSRTRSTSTTTTMEPGTLPEAYALYAHTDGVTALAWHPLGRVLSSVGRDYQLQFWSRNRPGDRMTDRYNLWSLASPSERVRAASDLLNMEPQPSSSSYSSMVSTREDPHPHPLVCLPSTTRYACTRLVTASARDSHLDPPIRL